MSMWNKGNKLLCFISIRCYLFADSISRVTFPVCGSYELKFLRILMIYKFCCYYYYKKETYVLFESVYDRGRKWLTRQDPTNRG